MRPTTLIRLAIFAIVVGGGIIGYVFRDRLNGSAGELRVGDCFELPSAQEVKDVQHRPCTEPHGGEVYAVLKFPDQASFPTDDQFDSFFMQQCVGLRFSDYVGRPYDESAAIEPNFFVPVEKGWAKGDRDVTCFLRLNTGSPMTGSFKRPA